MSERKITRKGTFYWIEHGLIKLRWPWRGQRQRRINWDGADAEAEAMPLPKHATINNVDEALAPSRQRSHR